MCMKNKKMIFMALLVLIISIVVGSMLYRIPQNQDFARIENLHVSQFADGDITLSAIPRLAKNIYVCGNLISPEKTESLRFILFDFPARKYLGASDPKISIDQGWFCEKIYGEYSATIKPGNYLIVVYQGHDILNELMFNVE